MQKQSSSILYVYKNEKYKSIQIRNTMVTNCNKYYSNIFFNTFMKKPQKNIKIFLGVVNILINHIIIF